MKHRMRLICLILFVALLCGCGVPEPSGGEHNSEDELAEHGRIAVYSEQQYKTALMQIFSHINLTEKTFSVDWVGDMEQADIVITNNLNKENYGNYQVIDVQKLSVKPVQQLIVQDDRGVIGVPVFLRLCGFWYDELLYSSMDLKVPQSMETWTQSNLYPTVCEKNDTEALIWGIIAPLYLYYGGTAAELSTGALSQETLSKAMTHLQALCDQNLLQVTDDARQSFTSTQAAFWLTGANQIAASYNYMSNRSKLGFVNGLILPAKEHSKCVVRADVLLVHKDADPAFAELFLQSFFREQTLIELSTDTLMPLACQVQYGPSVIPELAQICYTVLSSPSVEISYVSCGWSREQENALTQKIESVLENNEAVPE